MAPADDRMAFLVKGKGSAARGRFALGPAGANIHFSAEPLFRSIGAAGRLGAAPSGSQWFRVTADAGADSANPWDACHALMAQGQGVAAGGVEFAEPDLLQRWAVVPRPPSAAALAMREGRPHEQNKDDFPAIPADNFWFRDAKHGQFDAALAGLADPGAGKRTATIPTIAAGRSISARRNSAISSTQMRPTMRATVQRVRSIISVTARVP